ncbi:MAG TPA: helix-turn-helix transcriptional regulator [Jatrophihabitans sp.]
MVESEPAGRPGAEGDVNQRFGLTRREGELLKLVVARYGNAEIAGLLSISKRTVESHMAALLRKFGVADRPELIRTAAVASAPVAPRPGMGAAATVAWRRVGSAQARAATVKDRVAETGRRSRALLAEAHLRNSIVFHDVTARDLDAAATRWTLRASREFDPTVRAEAVEQAEVARRRAEAARSRAAQGRKRLGAWGGRAGADFTSPVSPRRQTR